MAGAGNTGEIQITAGDEFVEVSARADSALSIRTPALIAAFPIDDILQWSTIEVGAEIFTEHIDSAMAILIAVARDMGRDQHPRVGPKPRHRRVLEFTDIDVKDGATQMIALEHISEGILIDDLPAGDVDEHGSRFHGGEAIRIE